MSSQDQDGKQQRPRRPPMRLNRRGNFNQMPGRRPPIPVGQSSRQDLSGAAPTQPVQPPATGGPQVGTMPAQFPMVAPGSAVPYFSAAQPHGQYILRQVPLQFPQPSGQLPPTVASGPPSGTGPSAAPSGPTATPASASQGVSSGNPARRPPIVQQQTRIAPQQFPGVVSLQQMPSGQMMIPQQLLMPASMGQPVVGISGGPQAAPIVSGSGPVGAGLIPATQPVATLPQGPPPSGVPPTAATTSAAPAAIESPKRRGQPWGSKMRPTIYGWATIRQVSSGQSLQIECRKYYKKDPTENLKSSIITLLLDCVICPSLGRRQKSSQSGPVPDAEVEFSEDEPFAFEAKEFTRKLLLRATRFNRDPVMFAAWDQTKLKSSNMPRYFGDIYIPNKNGDPRSLSYELVAAGWGEIKTSRDVERPPGSLDKTEYQRLITANENAQANARGKYQGNPENHTRELRYTSNYKEVYATYLGQNVTAIVDYVVDACTLRVELCPLQLNAPRFANLTVRLAGVRVHRPRQSDTPSAAAGFANEARTFVQKALLDHDVELRFVTADQSNLYAQVIHPTGRRIACALLFQGWAELQRHVVKELQNVDAAEVAEMKNALEHAQSRKLKIWKDRAITDESDQREDVTVTRILSGDKLEVRYINGTKEVVRLSSIRAPTRLNGEPQAFFRAAKEFLRGKVIGKQVEMYVDYKRAIVPYNRGEQKEVSTEATQKQIYATIYTETGENVAESLLRQGLANIFQHGSSGDPSRDYIRLQEAHDKAKQKNVFKLDGNTAERDPPADFSLQDRPDSRGRGAPRGGRGRGGGRQRNKGANPNNRDRVRLFNKLKNMNSPTKCIVEMIFSSTKFKLYLEDSNAFIAFQLMHIRCERAPPPQTRHNHTIPPGQSSGNPGLDAWRFASDTLMQREVSIEVLETEGNTAKGNLYFGEKNLAAELLAIGLAETFSWRPRSRDGPPVRSPPVPRDYDDLQTEAAKQKLGIWSKTMNPEDTKEEDERNALSSKIGQEMSLVVSHIASATEFWANLEEHSVMLEQVVSALEDYTRVEPARIRRDQLYVGKYNDIWTRCRAVRLNPKREDTWFVVFIDYGNRAAIGKEKIGNCPVELKEKNFPALAFKCQLAGLRPPPKMHHPDLFNLTGQHFAMNVLEKTLRFKVLFDTNVLRVSQRRGAQPGLLGQLFDKDTSVNQMMVRDGFARLDDDRLLRSLVDLGDDETTAYVASIKEMCRNAMDQRVNIWVSGDINTDDEGN